MILIRYYGAWPEDVFQKWIVGSLAGGHDSPEADDASREDQDSGDDENRGREEKGDRVLLDSGQHVHSEARRDGGHEAHRQVHGLHVERQPNDLVAALVLKLYCKRLKWFLKDCPGKIACDSPTRRLSIVPSHLSLVTLRLSPVTRQQNLSWLAWAVNANSSYLAESSSLGR